MWYVGYNNKVAPWTIITNSFGYKYKQASVTAPIYHHYLCRLTVVAGGVVAAAGGSSNSSGLEACNPTDCWSNHHLSWSLAANELAEGDVDHLLLVAR